MSQDVIIALGLLAVGLIASLTITIPLFFQLNINANLFIVQIKKLVAADNVERAIKLCTAAGNSVVAQGTKGMLLAHGLQGATDSTALQNAFDKALPDLYNLIKKLRVLGFVALGCLALAALQLLKGGANISHIPPHALVAGGALLFSVILGEKKLADIKKDAKWSKEQVLAVVVARG